jgi:class 3 adenylate cyclase/tetratricopeptide (TPR) repeat protein
MANRCAQCGQDNQADASACIECGSLLGVACPQCHERLPANARFCLQCGAPARRSSVPAGNPGSDGERRHLIVLFCDLVGSTAIAERLDPEDWRDTVVRFQQEVTGVIEQSGGYVAQHLGDGLLVYFGYPRAREDDTERAVRCGLALVKATRALNPELKALYDVELSLRVGLHHGPVVVSEVGGTRRETLALGSTANLAARVQSAAEPDTVFVTESVHQRIQRLFVLEDRGEHRLKGIERPARLYAVMLPSGARERFDRTGSGLTPFINRAQELSRVASCFAHVESGQGRAIAIRAEPGMGKSRLALAFRQSIAQRPHVWYECRAAPYNRDSPLQPWLQLQRELLGIGSASSNAEQLRKLEESLTRSGFDAAEAVPLFANLHGLELSPPYALPQLGPLGLRKKTLALLADWVLRLGESEADTRAEQRTLRSAVLLIEDLHWLDPSSIELIGLLLERMKGASLLLLLTHRPEFEPPWPEVEPLTHLVLPRLEAREARSLVGASAGGALSEERIDAIALRSEGVPLFAEELARAVLGHDVNQTAEAASASTIPETLEDSLMARLEQAGDVKELAQLASVLGREFPLALLERFQPDDLPALHAALSRAEQGHVLLRVESDEGPLYFFRHALIRDAAYNSMLRKTRRRHHLTVAQTLRGYFPDVVRKQPELLAHHLTEAKEQDAAIDAWLSAALLAQGRAAYEEAIRHLRQAQELVSEQPGDPRALDIEQMLGGALVVARGWAHEETRAAWEAAARLCDAAKEPLRAGAIACGLGDVYSSLDLEKSLLQFEALVFAGQRDNLPLLQIAGHQGAAIPLRYLGRYAEARAHLDAGLAIYDPTQHLFVAAGFHEEKGISLLCWSAWLHWDVGALDAARRDAQRAMELAARFRNAFALGFASAWAAIVETWSSNWPAAIALGERAAKLAADHGFQLLEAMGRFAELSGRGVAEKMSEAPALFGLEIQRLAKTGNRLGGAEVFAVLANLQLEQGAIEPALSAIEIGLGLSSALGQPWCDAWLLTLKARCLSLQGSGPEPEALLTRALEIARAQGARSYELRAAAALAERLHGQARSHEAAELLRPVLTQFDAQLASPELNAARQLMSLLP